MRLVMVGLDYTTAAMEIRERFSPDAAARDAVLRRLVGGDVAGCVLLATCNRTELYLSHRSDVPPDGASLLCDALGLDAATYRKAFNERFERQAAEHLMRVAGGLCSNVPGDDQIITQVRSAIDAAREAGAADALLEALFRSAVAAGKKIKTRVSFAREGTSAAGAALETAERLLGDLHDKRALVIGNGVIGRLAAEGLLKKGCQVVMTLRDAGRRDDMPAGCEYAGYDNRHEAMERCDVVVSATSSPHHTVTLAEARSAKSLPALFVDLAMPRDIDPAVARLPGVTVVNIDDLVPAGSRDRETRDRFAAAGEIVEAEAGRFDLWRRNRARRAAAGVSGVPDFPIFINLHGATVLVAGGGAVAARRAEKLLSFGARVHVVSPELSPGMSRLSGRAGFHWTRDEYRAEHMEGAVLAIAATDSREANRRLGRDAKERGVLASVADRREECTFYFPAIVRSDYLTAGVVSNNGDHRMVRKAAAKLLQEMEAMDEEYQGGESREPLGDGAGAAGHGCYRAKSS